MAKVLNRYLLTGIVSKATRMLHRHDSRLEDTSNDVFRILGWTNPMADRGPADAAARTSSRSFKRAE